MQHQSSSSNRFQLQSANNNNNNRLPSISDLLVGHEQQACHARSMHLVAINNNHNNTTTTTMVEHNDVHASTASIRPHVEIKKQQQHHHQEPYIVTESNTTNKNMHNANFTYMRQSQLEYIQLERKCEEQSQTITQLQHENKKLKDEIARLKRKRVDMQLLESTSTKRKTSNSSNVPSSSTCFTFSSVTLDQESLSSDHSEIDSSQMVVKWNSKEYYLVGAFKSISSRTRVLVNFVPMFEKQHPDKECKLVLNSEDFRRLVKENPHLFKHSKHTWRISLFSSDFYQYVKSKTNQL